jgi:hypothetical protein
MENVRFQAGPAALWFQAVAIAQFSRCLQVFSRSHQLSDLPDMSQIVQGPLMQHLLQVDFAGLLVPRAAFAGASRLPVPPASLQDRAARRRLPAQRMGSSKRALPSGFLLEIRSQQLHRFARMPTTQCVKAFPFLDSDSPAAMDSTSRLGMVSRR